jgi:hypothetical protein
MRNVFISRILFALTIGSFLDVLTVLAGGSHGIVEMITPVLAAATLTISGDLILRAFRVTPTAAWLPLAFVVGSTVTSIAMLPLVVLLGLSAQTGFLICTALSLVLSSGLGKKLPGTPAPAAGEIGIAIALTVLIGFFARGAAADLPDLRRSYILSAWADYFVHGTILASFGDPLALGRGDMMLAGQPRVFYHYGPFMLPAALSELTHLPGLGLALAVMLPLGLLIGIFGLYALAVEIAGVGPALFAVWAVACLPDSSHYLMQNGFYGFHWLLYTAPASGYAIGTGAAAFGCVVQWSRRGAIGPLALGILLTLMLLMVRAHIFLLMAPALAGSISLAATKSRWRKQIVAGVALGIAIPSVLVTLAGSRSPWLGFSRPFEYFAFAFQNGPVRYEHLLTFLTVHIGRPVAAVAALAMLTLAALGVWVLIYPVVEGLRAHAGKLQAEDAFPILLCVSYILLLLWAPEAGNGDLSEYKQRHFVFLYAIIVLWAVAHLAQNAGIPEAIQPARGRASLVFLAVIALTMVTFRHFDPSRPSLSWAGGLYAGIVPQGLPEASGFIRSHSRPGDLLTVGGPPFRGSGYEPAVEIVSLADLPLYVGRVQLQTKMRPQIAAIVQERVNAVERVDESPDGLTAFNLLQNMKVRWYIRLAPDLPRWDPTGRNAAFRSGAVVAYDAARNSAFFR